MVLWYSHVYIYVPTHSLTHSLTHTLAHSLTLIHSLTHFLSIIYSHTHLPTHSYHRCCIVIFTLTHSLTHTHSLPPQSSLNVFSPSDDISCQSCDCHMTGSLDQHCSPSTGQCACLPGVTGRQCNVCMDGYAGMDHTGCKGHLDIHVYTCRFTYVCMCVNFHIWDATFNHNIFQYYVAHENETTTNLP